MSALPDYYLNASLLNGLPTCTFPPAPYPRAITNIVVGNGAPSTVFVYRGSLGSVPIAQNTLGSNNTLVGRLTIPIGQQFFVVWSAAGSPVSSAFARVSMERSDGPLDSAASSAATWAQNAVSRLEVDGANGSKIIITTEVSSQAEVLIYPPPQAGITIAPADLLAFAQTPGSPQPVLEIDSPGFNGHAQASLFLQGASADNVLAPQITLSAAGGTLIVDEQLTTLNDSVGGTSKRAWFVTVDENFDSTAVLNLTGVAQPIPGCAHTYNGLRPGCKWNATLFTDAGNGAVAGVNTIGELTVNANGAGAVVQQGQAIWRSNPLTNAGSMPSRKWSGIFAAGGTLAFQATGRFTGGGGANVFANPNTTLHIQIME